MVRDESTIDGIDRRTYLRAAGAGAGLAATGGFAGLASAATAVEHHDVVGSYDDGPGSWIATPTREIDDDFLDWCARDPQRCYEECPGVHEDCDLIEWGPGLSITVNGDRIGTVGIDVVTDPVVAEYQEIATSDDLVAAVDDLVTGDSLTGGDVGVEAFELTTDSDQLNQRNPVAVDIPYAGYGLGALSTVLVDGDGGKVARNAVGRTVEVSDGTLVERLHAGRRGGELVTYEDPVQFDPVEVEEPLKRGWNRHHWDPYPDDRYCGVLPWLACWDGDRSDLPLWEVGLLSE